jgi:hypothetical protein
VERKLGLLDEPHVAPLTQFVRQLRSQRGGGESVPWFDPDEGGVGARILLLLEAPGPRATGPGGPRPAARGSGFISCDNDDQSAANLWALLDQAGVDRREIATWNVVPWYVGDETVIRPVSGADLEEARPALRELVSLLPQVRVVVLLGRKAAAGWRRAGVDLPTIEAPHPSPLVVNVRPAARARIRGALMEARRRAGLLEGAPAPRPGRTRVATTAFPRPHVATPSSPPIDRSTLETTLRRLAAGRPLFQSEADFQHALAWQLHLDHPAARVRLETRPLPGRPLRLDLHIVVAEHRVAMELKYLTKQLAVTIDGETFDLRDHGADDQGRYDVVKDVARLEVLTDGGVAGTGYALLLTNQPS